tara:strand:- start:711 stop:1877 length:1167 start_codon:yes stop_codon:yes gene_type:complete
MSEHHAITRPVIVQILPTLNRGGVERGTVEIARAIIDRGYKAVVVSNGGLFESQLVRMGATVHRLPVHSKNPFRWPLIRSRLARILQSEGADIVHIRSRAPAWIALPVAKRLMIATVTTIHNKFVPQNAIKHIYNRKMLKADSVIAISNFIKSIIVKHYSQHRPADSVTVIHRGVDTTIFDPSSVTQYRIIREAERLNLPEDGYIIMLPARPTSWKGHEVLINAVAALNRPDVTLLLLGAGDGSPRFVASLEKLARKTGLGGRLRIAAGSDDMPSALMLADVIAMPSIVPEPFGRVAVEAGAMGRPIVAFNHGGAVESVLNGQTGWLAEPKDISDLSQALGKALDLSQAKRAELAKKARAHIIKLFSKEKMCQKTLEIYDELLRKRAG